MNYEKAYKNALAKAREIHRNEDEKRFDMEWLFPELRESEDERIREMIINTLNRDKFLTEDEAYDCVAWLENQGKELGEYKVKYTQEVLEKHINSMSNKDDERLRNTSIAFLKDFADKGYENAVECIDWLEKQWEQKKDICEGCNNVKGCVTCVDGSEKAKITEKNIKPKFKVGDFIANDYCRGRVVELTDDAYLLDTEQGIPFSYEHNAHLWSIQDAENGDILFAKGRYFKEYAFIYSGMTEDNVLSIYCGFDIARNNFDTKLTRFGRVEDFETVCPATKEQCEILFKAMHKARYQWDAEKKELSKCVIDDGKAEMDYCFTKMMNGEKVSPTWSEGDEYGAERLLGWLDTLVNYIHHDVTVSLDLRRDRMQQVEQLKNWFKSLKDKAQPKQEWSEEDEQYLLVCKNALKKYESTDKWDADIIFNWLKSLKDKITWKPNDFLDILPHLKEGDS